MKYKLLVLDVDGTLLNNEKEISKRTLSALLKVQHMGIRIVLASGRPTSGLLPIAKTLELGNFGGFMVSYNGCQIIRADTGEVMFERRINPEQLPYLEKKSRKNGFSIFTYHDDYLLTDNADNVHIRKEAWLNHLKIVEEEEFSIAIDFAPCKCVLVSDDEEALRGLENHWKRRLDGVRAVYAQEEGTSVQVFARDITPLEELNDIGIEHRVGYELTMECLKRSSRISGIVAVNDSVAYGVLDAIADSGLRVPDDYSVCGFNNLSSSRISHVGLTTVEHQTDAWARNAVDILYERIRGGNAVSDITRVAYAHRLLERRSTAPFHPSSQEKQ